jgi:hypothetical protein
MNTQLELLAPKTPDVSEGEKQQVIGVLEGKGWLTANQVLTILGLPRTETKRRWLRSVANASEGFILSYPGAPGYKMTTEANPLEVARAGVLNHQANAMRRRLVQIEHVYHHKLKWSPK